MYTLQVVIAYLVTLAAVVAAFGALAWPRRKRPATLRALRTDFVVGIDVLRGAGRRYAEIMDRYLDHLYRLEMRNVGTRP